MNTPNTAEVIKEIMDPPTTLELWLAELEKEGHVTFCLEDGTEEATADLAEKLKVLIAKARVHIDVIRREKKQLRVVDAQLDLHKDQIWDIVKEKFTEDQMKVYEAGCAGSINREAMTVTINKHSEDEDPSEGFVSMLKDMKEKLLGELKEPS